jgi:Dynamin family.
MEERFQINVVLLGPVSAGKSTFTNALFVEQYTDMKLQRTTATPQVYHEIKDITICKTSLTKIREHNREINQKIMAKSNEKGLTMEDIKEIEYYVPKIFDMPRLENDVLLSIYDTPGINDAKTEKIYSEYVQNYIYKFDIIILLIDIHSSFNTKEEISILELVISQIKENKEKYNIEKGFMILLNKCDEIELDNKKELVPSDEDLKIMYDQAKKVVESSVNKLCPGLNYSMFPISCEDTYIYRMYNRNINVQLDEKYINKLGSNEFGNKQWKNLKPIEKNYKIKELLRNLDFQNRMMHSGFSKFKEEFSKILEKKRQYIYLANHIKYNLHKITDIKNSQKLDINTELDMLRNCHNKLKLLKVKFGRDYDEKDYKLVEEKIISFMDEYKKNIIETRLNVIPTNVESLNIYMNIVNILKKGKSYFYNLWEKYKIPEEKMIENINNYYLNELKNQDLKYEKILEYLDELVKNKYELKKIQEIIYSIFDGVTRYTFLKEKSGITYVEYLKTINNKYKIPTHMITYIGFNMLISIYNENKSIGKHLQYYKYWNNVIIKKNNTYCDHVNYIKLILNDTRKFILVFKKEEYHYDLEEYIYDHIKSLYNKDIIMSEEIIEAITNE